MVRVDLQTSRTSDHSFQFGSIYLPQTVEEAQTVITDDGLHCFLAKDSERFGINVKGFELFDEVQTLIFLAQHHRVLGPVTPVVDNGAQVLV